MFAKLRAWVTYANVVATLALIIAVGGGSAYALQGRNTVFSDDIAFDAVKAADAKEESLKIPRIVVQDDSVVSTAADQQLIAVAECPTGYSVTGGGYSKSDSAIRIRTNIPYFDQDDYDQWYVEGYSHLADQQVSASAVCQRGRTEN